MTHPSVATKTTRDVSAPRGTFFGAADDTVSGLLGQSGFNESLVYHVLFGRSIVIDETFLFNSSLLLSHVDKARGRSLFETAAREGMVAPAFHVLGEKDLRSALERMHETYAPGFLPRTLGRNHLAIVDAVQSGLQAEAIAYPLEGFGLAINYQRAMEMHFLGEVAPPDVSSNDWEAMRGWRMLIPEACESTRARGQKGLQRAELVRGISRTLGVSPTLGLLPLEVLLAQCGTPTRERSLRSFWGRMNHIHMLNSAKGFSLSASLPAYEAPSASVLGVSRPLSIMHQVKWPSTKALLRVEPEKLVKARMIEGNELFDLIRRAPSSHDDIKDALDRYSRCLC